MDPRDRLGCEVVDGDVSPKLWSPKHESPHRFAGAHQIEEIPIPIPGYVRVRVRKCDDQHSEEHVVHIIGKTKEGAEDDIVRRIP